LWRSWLREEAEEGTPTTREVASEVEIWAEASSSTYVGKTREHDYSGMRGRRPTWLLASLWQGQRGARRRPTASQAVATRSPSVRVRHVDPLFSGWVGQ
jgi:hypothetical protein